MSEPATHDKVFTEQIYPALLSLAGLARRFTRSEADAEELQAIVAERAWRYREAFDPERATAKAWVATIIRNEAARMATSPYARLISTVDPAMISASRRFSTEDDLDEYLDGKDELAALRAAVEKLAPYQRETVAAIERCDYHYPTIAAAEGIPIGTVCSRIHRTKIALRRALAA